jgi:hypothetical protein
VVNIEKYQTTIDAMKKVLGNSYLLSYTTFTHIILFLPGKYDKIKELLHSDAVRYEGCCYYFKNFSVALWQDVEDAVGFQGEIVCCAEFFEGKINRDFHWRKPKQAQTTLILKGKNIQTPFHIECPYCRWVYLSEDSCQKYIKRTCKHCRKSYFFKIIVIAVNVEIVKKLPANSFFNKKEKYDN